MNLTQQTNLLRARSYLLNLQESYNKTPANAKGFDMTAWAITDSSNSCGFVGCAIGHMAHDRLFEVMRLNDYLHLPEVLEDGEWKTVSAYRMQPLANLFGLDWDELYYLFMPRSYRTLTDDGDVITIATPGMVAERIDEVLAKHEEEIIAEELKAEIVMQGI